MPVTAIVGANWGDEGKGKTTDYLAAQADVVARFQGGNNAGHTIINDYGKFVLHLLPAGVFYPHTVNVLGPGVAVNIPALLEELDGLIQRGIPQPVVKVSDRAQVVLPYHLLLDEYEEERLAESHGLATVEMAGCQGLSAGLVEATNLLAQDEAKWQVWTDLVVKTSTEPAVVDMAEHILYIGRKP